MISNLTEKRHMEAIQDIAKDVEMHTDMILDRMINNDKNLYGMIRMDRAKFEWILSRFEKIIKDSPDAPRFS